MNVVRLNEQDIDLSIIDQAATIIKNGGIVAFPTETVYGLGADATNSEAIARIFEIKGRPPDNPLIAHVHSLDQARAIAKFIPQSAAEKLAESFWPGPLTLVLKKNAVVSDVATAGLDTLAVRMPSNRISLQLIERAAVPIVAPSANLSGLPSPTEAAHVAEDIGDMIDMIIDGGHTRYGIESTVVDVSTEKPVILRLGTIPQKDIEMVVGEVSVSGTSDGAPKAPGMKYTHYSPAAKVILVKQPGAIYKVHELYKDREAAGYSVEVMSFDDYEDDLKGLNRTPVSGLNDPETYMRKLYATLRELDKRADVILVIDVPEGASWMAVKDKLKKASNDIK